MKKITLIIFMFCALQTFAQKLYLHDIQNGNYKSYDIGSKIQVFVMGNTTSLTGEIIGITKDSFYLSSYPIGIATNQVLAVLRKKNSSAKTVLLYGVSGILMLPGGLYTLAGLIIMSEDPALGLLGIAIGGSLFGTGFWIASNAKKSQRIIVEKPIDQMQFRLFIE